VRTLRLVLLVVAAVAATFVGCKKESKAKWTILAYMAGNNNLDTLQNGSSWVIGDCQEMEEIGSTGDVQIVAMVGSLRKGGNSKVYHVEKHLNEQPDQISSTVLEDLGGKDMSDKATLRDFVRKYVSQYPAERYMLIIDDHGGGWYGACEDNQNGSGDMMSMSDMRDALKDTVKFDVVVFHACLMSMVEVAYELKDCADYMVACQFTMPMQSILGSDKWLADLAANPEMAPLDISKKIVDAVYQTAGEKQKDCHMAVTDLTKIQALAAKVKDLGNNIVTEVGDDWGEVLQAFSETHYTQYDHPAFVDLREYAKKIKQMPNLQNRNMIKTAADDVIAAINDAVPLTKTNVTAIPRGGLCIHFPYKTELFDSVKYVKLQFASWNWQNFLSKFIALAGGGGGAATVTGTALWQGGQPPSTRTLAFVDTVAGSQAVPIAQGQVSSVNGSYSISVNITAARQVLADAWDDVNGDGDWTPGVDGWGFYDPDGDQQWTANDLFTISPGQTTPNINMTIELATDRPCGPIKKQ